MSIYVSIFFYGLTLKWINLGKNLWTTPHASLESNHNAQIMKKGGWVFTSKQRKTYNCKVHAIKHTWQVLEIYTKYQSGCWELENYSLDLE